MKLRVLSSAGLLAFVSLLLLAVYFGRLIRGFAKDRCSHMDNCHCFPLSAFPLNQ